MATNDRSRWREARENYLDELDRRFPNHPYRESTRAWREQIADADTEGRARILESPVPTRLNEPRDELEKRWVLTYKLVDAARNLHDPKKLHDDPEAVRLYEELADRYREDDEAERPWRRLALKRAEEVRSAIAKRDAEVDEYLRAIEDHERHGRTRQARGLVEKLKELSEQYTDVARRLGEPAPAAPPPAPAEAAPVPAPAPAASPPPASNAAPAPASGPPASEPTPAVEANDAGREPRPAAPNETGAPAP
jgi:hypothetical protein